MRSQTSYVHTTVWHSAVDLLHQLCIVSFASWTSQHAPLGLLPLPKYAYEQIAVMLSPIFFSMGVKVPGNEVPWSESSWDIRSWEAKVLRVRKFHGTKVLTTFRSTAAVPRNESFTGTKVPSEDWFSRKVVTLCIVLNRQFLDRSLMVYYDYIHKMTTSFIIGLAITSGFIKANVNWSFLLSLVAMQTGNRYKACI